MTFKGDFSEARPFMMLRYLVLLSPPVDVKHHVCSPYLYKWALPYILNVMTKHSLSVFAHIQTV